MKEKRKRRPKRRGFHATIRGKRYYFDPNSRIRKKDQGGECDAPWVKNKKIKIHASLDDEQWLRIVLDEALHACFWDLDNDVIDEAAQSLAKVLFKSRKWWMTSRWLS